MSSAIPIRNGGDQSIPLQFHRDSFAHSQGMGGISWGGASVGSWLRDEVLMATKENKEVANNFGNLLAGSAISDSMDHGAGTPHDSGLGSMAMSPDQPAYFPSIEANFCRDYSCCGNILPTLHDLLRHYEEQHISPSPPDEPPVMRRMQNIETVSTNDVFLPFDQPRHHGVGGGNGNHGGLIGNNLNNRIGDHSNTQRLQGHGINSNSQNATRGHNASSELNRTENNAGGLGVDGLDFDDFDDDTGAANTSQHQNQQAFAPPSFQPLNQGLGNFNSFGTSQSVMSRSKYGTGLGNDLPDAGVAGGFGTDVSAGAASGTARMALGDDEEPTIDDPARQLYMLERSENKPFKCPVIGCEKTYKNQNGLKYHRQHGHQNQTLHLNDDGTFSIIDPLSNTPYPDGMGMEKDKPYRCEICGKRYKNLNGLKYHRAHSTH